MAIREWIDRLVRPEPPRGYRDRSCSAEPWKAAFDTSDMEVVREFLGEFCDAFVIDRRYAFKLRPDDRVHDIYRARYSGRFDFGDMLELEELCCLLEGRGAPLCRSWEWETITLGELARRVVPLAHGHGEPS